MSNLVKVLFTKATIHRETNKHYEIGDTASIPVYLFERWRRNRIVQEYNGDKKKMTPDEAYDKMNIKGLQLEAEKLGIAFAGKNKKQLLKEISKKNFFYPKAESTTTVDEIVKDLPKASEVEEETFEELEEKTFEEFEKGDN